LIAEEFEAWRRDDARWCARRLEEIRGRDGEVYL
jgi:hypothetical protein